MRINEVDLIPDRNSGLPYNRIREIPVDPIDT
jgi:hypothetical protein